MLGEALPAGQLAQASADCAPAAAEYVPCGQGAQVVLPEVEVYAPAEQVTHTNAPTPEYCPFGQSRQPCESKLPVVNA